MAKDNIVGGRKKKIQNMVVIVILTLVFLFYMLPFLMVIINAFKSKRDIITNPLGIFPKNGLTLDNFAKAFEKMNFLSSFGNSLFVTCLSTLFVVLLSAMLAYYLVRNRSKMSNIVFSILIASMIIPFQAIMIPLVSIYGSYLNLLNHRLVLIFMHTGFAMSMSVFIYHGFIKSNIPLTLEEAACLDGCTKVQTFFKVVFPLLKPTTATLVILNVLAFWNDFLLPSLVLTEKKLLTLPLSTYKFYGTYSADYGTIMAGLVLTVAPILVLYLFLQRHIISGVVSGAVKS